MYNCCDLLEKSYFCSIANNPYRPLCIPRLVVICLKNRTFAVSQTTDPTEIGGANKLWFAWKIVLLQYRKQRRPFHDLQVLGCDLLEKSYFCSIANNHWLQEVALSWLWFAWKIVLLQYRKQLFRYVIHHVGRCDLLEKSYFCSIANNYEQSAI